MCVFLFFFFKQKTAYEMRISDWSSDVCSYDLVMAAARKKKTASKAKRKATGKRKAAPKKKAAAKKSPARKKAAGKRGATAKPKTPAKRKASAQIGRASCRDRVCQYV